MLWRRSWPDPVPPGRSYVFDPHSIPRLVNKDLGYGDAIASVGESFVMVEWDLALDALDRAAFEAAITKRPNRVCVAPFRLFPASTGWDRPVWAHRQVTGELAWRWVEEGEPQCDWFGFGLIYFPAAVLKAARPLLETMRTHLGADALFSAWHFPRYGPVDIVWDARPKHIHW